MTTPEVKRKNDPVSIETLFERDHSVFNLVFMHGLNFFHCKDHHRKSWLASNEFLWPFEFGKQHVECSVYLLKYDANSRRLFNSKLDPTGTGDSVLAGFIAKGKTLPPRPTIFICHSLGGLILKYAIARASNSDTEYKKRFLTLINHVIFIATPHHGSKQASWARFFLGWLLTPLALVLESNSEKLQGVHEKFIDWLETKNPTGMAGIVTSYYETKPYKWIFGQIVSSSSATLKNNVDMNFRNEEVLARASRDHVQAAKAESLSSDLCIRVEEIIACSFGWLFSYCKDFSLLDNFFYMVHGIRDWRGNICIFATDNQWEMFDKVLQCLDHYQNESRGFAGRIIARAQNEWAEEHANTSSRASQIPFFKKS